MITLSQQAELESASGDPLRSPDRSALSPGATSSQSDCNCAHCHLPVPSGLFVTGAENQFCCNGCRTAFEIIHQCNLDEFYQFAENQQSLAESTERNYGHFDSEEFLERHTKPFTRSKIEEASLREVQFALQGLHCNACIWLIEKLPRICDSVASARVNWSSQVVTIVFDAQSKLSAVAQSLAKLGYVPSLFQPDATTESSNKENRRLLFDLGFAGAAAGNNMLVALAIYLGQYSGMNPAIERLLVFYSGIISLLSILGPGRQILRRAFWSLKTGTPHMDLPVAIGISVGAISGWVNLLADSSTVYFDSISVLVFVLLLGRYFQQLQQRKAISRVSLVKQMIPQFCSRVGLAGVEKVSIDQIVQGDQVHVDQGERIPVDGQIDQGTSTIDLAILTGESIPQKVAPADDVFAGSTNLGPAIVVKASGPASQSKIAEVFADVEKSIRAKSRIVQFADRVGARFVVGILFLAVITFILWLPNYAFAFNAAVAVLIVACPCALALATPLAISVALHSALRREILIKDGDVFELLAKVETVWFDKTGTLTRGNLQVTDWEGDQTVKRVVYDVESRFPHPTAVAIVRSLEGEDSVVMNSEESVALSNLEQWSDGVKADSKKGKIMIGTKKFLQQSDIGLTDRQIEKESQYLENGWSPVFVAVDSTCVAMLAIGDQIDSDSAEVIGMLRENYHVGILSGDRSEIVQRIALQLGIESERSFGELSPHQKTDYVKQSRNSLMIGDGVNDCSALAAASVGIAICDQVDVNAKVASIVIKRKQLQQMPQLLTASRRVMNLIYRNIGISILYNIAAVGLAMSGYIHPLIAALFMPISSITILLMSLACDPFAKREQQ